MKIIILLLALLQVPAPSKPYRGWKGYPRVPEPTHLQTVPMNVSFFREEHHWYGSRLAEVHGKVRIEQKRPKDGWYLCGYQYLDAYGKLISPMQIDPTWRNPTVILVALLDNLDNEISHVEIQADSKKLLAGETLTEKAVFQ